jgi:hypothetical protein
MHGHIDHPLELIVNQFSRLALIQKVKMPRVELGRVEVFDLTAIHKREKIRISNKVY